MRACALEGHGISVVGATADPVEAVQLLRRVRPAYLLVASEIGVAAQEQAILDTRRSVPAVEPVVFSRSDDPADISRAFAAGSAAYVVTTSEPEEVAAAARAALARVGAKAERATGKAGSRRTAALPPRASVAAGKAVSAV
jgi:DNA-binding NarL/FixJ family response regulator